MPPYGSSMNGPSVFGTRTPSEPTDDHPSPNSDDGVYGRVDGDDAERQSLISQTLNADGTPKRPMNAFMIFARRRRPIVSAENQSMRTGEISKILSKEWNSMPAVEKQFFLDSAKQLKDTFNSRYPDYVYRRRPNNTRKRRRADSSGGMRSPDVADGGDDYAGNADAGEISPVDDDSLQFSHASTSALSHHYGGYSTPDEIMIRSAGTPNARSISSSGERLNNSVAELPLPTRVHPQSQYYGGRSQYEAEPGPPLADNWSSRNSGWGVNAQALPIPSSGYVSNPSYSSGWNTSPASQSSSASNLSNPYPLPGYNSFTSSSYTSESSSLGSSSSSYRSVPSVRSAPYGSSSLSHSPEFTLPYMPRSNSDGIQSISNYSNTYQSVNGGGPSSTSPNSHYWDEKSNDY